MHNKPLKRGVVAASVLAIGCFGTPVSTMAASLEELLIKKGIITKKELEEIKAEDASEKALRQKEIQAEVDRKVDAKVAEKIESEFPVKASWGKKGFRLETRDGNWATNLQWRAQMRYSYPYGSDPRQVSQFQSDEQSTFELRRVRMKIGGHGYRPWLKYYFEVDLQPTRDFDDSSSSASSRLIDWRAMLEKYEFAALQVGQWKINYNRERVDSSGKQEFVERSIVNRQFTVDRQMGAMVRGHLFPGTVADSGYYLGVFNGEGRGVRNDTDDMMYMGRVEWNFLGREVPWSQTDVQFTEDPAASVSFGAASNIGRCTRWSSSGCGNLDGFASPSNAAARQFKIVQMQQGAAFRWHGLALQQEFHWKNITDRVNGTNSNMTGSYAQIGYFFHDLIPIVPEPLEFAFRYAFVDEPNQLDVRINNTRQEFTTAANWFFAGHNNKLTLDFSYLTLRDRILHRYVSDERIRFQWDVSF